MNRYTEHNHRLHILSNGENFKDKEEFENRLMMDKIFTFTNRHVPTTKKAEIIDQFDNYELEYSLNSDGFRCEEFKNNHKDLHILFAGCSNTFGVGTEYEKTWAYLTYKKIMKEKNNEYYNIGAPGSSIFEIIINVYKYIKEFGTPDIIFLLLPDMERDARYFLNPERSVTILNTEIYNNFELFCKTNKIKLIASTWIMSSGNQRLTNFSNLTLSKENILQPAKNVFTEESISYSKKEDPYLALQYLERFSDTFKLMNLQNIQSLIYQYSLNNKDDLFMYTAPDIMHHHGNAFHYAWSEYFYERYLNEKNNI